MFSAAVYVQGAGFHSASAMFKQPVKALLQLRPDVTGLSDIYTWMRDAWEHIYSHYLYAAGGVGMSFAQAYAFRNALVPKGIVSMIDVTIWICASIVYGLIIGSIAVQFIWGSTVVFVFLIVYGFGILGFFTVYNYRSQAFSLGKRFVLQYFMFAYGIAFVITVIWIGIAKGFNSKTQGNV